MKEPIAALREADLARFERLLDLDPSIARSAQVIVEAGRQALLPALEALGRHGADFNVKHRGYRALHSLIQERPHGETSPSKERLASLSWLLAHGADPDQAGAWPPARALVIAAFMGLPPFVETLMEGGAKVNSFAACALADVGFVERTLKKTPAFVAERDTGGLTALQCTAGSRMGSADADAGERLLRIAGLLLDAGAGPGERTPSWSHDIDACYLAVGARSADMLALLLERGADATGALGAAAWSGSRELGEIVLGHGARVNEARSEGRPLLNELVRWGQVRPALWLLEHGADPNIADDRGWTALHQAASRGNERMLLAILGAGGDRSLKDNSGWTPRDVAADRGHHALVEALGGRAPRRPKKSS